MKFDLSFDHLSFYLLGGGALVESLTFPKVVLLAWSHGFIRRAIIPNEERRGNLRGNIRWLYIYQDR